MQLSLLDLLHVAPGQTSYQAFQDTVALSQHLESLGFVRHWIVEHHGVDYELSADPMLMALALASRTQRMRIGVGGILLNNYSPYKIAESVKTLSMIAPDRIDIGLGQSTSGSLQDLALQVDRAHKPVHDQQEKLQELLGHLYTDLPQTHAFAKLKVLPEIQPPLPWIMAVTANSAARAGAWGLPLALSAFHRPEEAVGAAQAYRKAFRPANRPGLPQQPQVFLALRLITGETQEEALRNAMPMRWAYDQRRRLGQMPTRLPSIDEAVALCDGVWAAETSEWPMYVICPTREVHARLSRMAQAVGATEVMVQDALPNHAMRLAHYQSLAEAIAKG